MTVTTPPPATPDAPAAPPGRGGPRLLLLPLLAGALIVVVALVALAATLSAAPATALVPAPALVTWGTPVIRAAHHLGMLLAVGAAGTVVLLLPGPGGRLREHHASDRTSTRFVGAARPLARLAGSGALLWALASLTLIPLGGLEALGTALTLGGPTGGPAAPTVPGGGPWEVALDTDLGRIRLGVVVLAALAALFLLTARGTVAACWGLVFGVLGTLSLGLAGHAGSSLEHINAVNGLALHLLGVVTWCGGLLAILSARPLLSSDDLAVVVRRFSPWALFSVVVIALGGLISAVLRIDAPAQLVTTPYGLLVLAKTLLLVALAVLGALQRRRLGDALRFRHLALTEGALMAVVIGLSIVLARTAPPVPQTVPAVGDLRVMALVGFAPPSAPFSLAALFTQWHLDAVALLIALGMAAAYVAGVVRLRRRGDSWPAVRVVVWLLGCLALVWVTSGGPAAYGHTRFDAHMVQHMALMMIVPPLWVRGAPVTLLTRAVAPRRDGSRGLREWVLAGMHSGYARVVSTPPMAGLFFAGSLVAFYFTPLFELSLAAHLGHVLMVVHFLLVGYLFAWVLIGLDPSPREINPVMKLVTLLVTLSFHAFFGVAVVSAVFLLAEDWYRSLGMYTSEQLALIQERGGSIMWGVSEVPTLVYAIVLAWMWTSSDERRAKQWDRKADRDGEAELEAYNRYLAGLRDQDR
ncbi:bifunctional copper resistance protein CopD/cytochrome c oxidase assembly protein [Brachybacterium sp. EF45031]|uniref:bifunctional copper resistance protein CopD/cytochrome c oxidase assembly protein n=1 Tax=Brachybacterium sillae TaxID=2810536 RepID=UPI00217D1D70|nr:bifunctional copper resistance protein CopD/cytochrome c oxidase assembly protein [Brachybacterium sillae]MCS6711110.1 bifunctional copper resistance protein CopD/cytochrome c oxidase assembly protein [Brachybacterium sillae]